VQCWRRLWILLGIFLKLSLQFYEKNFITYFQQFFHLIFLHIFFFVIFCKSNIRKKLLFKFFFLSAKFLKVQIEPKDKYYLLHFLLTLSHSLALNPSHALIWSFYIFLTPFHSFPFIIPLLSHSFSLLEYMSFLFTQSIPFFSGSFYLFIFRTCFIPMKTIGPE